MLIWDYIRDFLVQYIFGGTTSAGLSYKGVGIGNTYCTLDGAFDDIANEGGMVYFKVGESLNNGKYEYFTSLSDWLATTTTIIIMCLIVVLFAMLVRWVFKTVVSAFLLR